MIDDDLYSRLVLLFTHLVIWNCLDFLTLRVVRVFFLPNRLCDWRYGGTFLHILLLRNSCHVFFVIPVHLAALVCAQAQRRSRVLAARAHGSLSFHNGPFYLSTVLILLRGLLFSFFPLIRGIQFFCKYFLFTYFIVTVTMGQGGVPRE